jgi:hypothetical protein
MQAAAAVALTMAVLLELVGRAAVEMPVILEL